MNTNSTFIAWAKKNKAVVILGFLVLAVAILKLAEYQVVGSRQVLLNKTVQKIPSYFVPSDAQVSLFTPADTSQLRLMKNESLGEGIRYEVAKPKVEAVKEVVATMDKEGWIAVAGSMQDENKTILKMRNSSEAIFVIFEGGKAEAKTLVTILPVEREGK